MKVDKNDIIEMLYELCDVLLDMPCGCDCCPYKKTINEETGECDVSNMIQQLQQV